jgi:hypothetical protein
MASIIENIPTEDLNQKMWQDISDCYTSINFGIIKNKILSDLED